MSQDQEIQQYIGTKVVNAIPMTRLEYNQFRGWDLPADEDGSDKGFLVEYVDGGEPNTDKYAGYVSWSPDDVFQAAYRETSGMSFGLAIEAMKKGLRVARVGWSGVGVYAYYVPAKEYDAETDIAKTEFGDKVPYRHYFALKTVQNDVATWAPSPSDALADDWMVVE